MELEDTYIVPKMTLKELEKDFIVQTLNYLKGDLTEAAKSLGISSDDLVNKLTEHKIFFNEEGLNLLFTMLLNTSKKE